MNKEDLAELDALMTKAIDLQRALEEFWRKVPESGLNSEDVVNPRRLIPKLKKMIIARIEVLNSFELLTKLSPDDALEVLQARYLGKGVCADRKFGGYQFELETMLDDVVKNCGADSLHKLIANKRFDDDKLNDSRVMDSLCEALSLDSREAFEAWRALR